MPYAGDCSKELLHLFAGEATFLHLTDNLVRDTALCFIRVTTKQTPCDVAIHDLVEKDLTRRRVSELYIDHQLGLARGPVPEAGE